MTVKGVFIAIEAVLANLHIGRSAEEGHTLAARLDEMRNCLERALVVVDHHAAGIDAHANAIVEHERHTILEQIDEVPILLGVLGLRHNDAAHLVLVERPADFHLVVVHLVALRHQDAVATARRLLLDAAEHRREIIMNELRNNNPDDTACALLAVAQALGYHIREIMVLLCKFLDFLALLATDARIVFQRTRHRSHRDAQHGRDIFHRQLCFILHISLSIIALCPTLRKNQRAGLRI